MKFFHDSTLKHLSTENKEFLQINKKDQILYGRISTKELLQMPWMFNVKPIWTSVPEPYTFTLKFTQVNKEAIQTSLSIMNGNAFLLKDLNLNVLKKI